MKSALNQDFTAEPFEIIIANDSGRPLPHEAYRGSPRVTIINCSRRERSFARNAGAAVARGEYLNFMDDDDWLLPNALQEFWRLSREFPAAAWLQAGIRIVDKEGTQIAEASSDLQGNCLAQIMGGAWAPIQSACIRADVFFKTGGFNPLICGTEDQDLCRQIAAREDIVSTKVVVACLTRGRGWNTSTNYQRAGEDTRISRDSVVGQPGVFRRMLRSGNSCYWRGRVFHVYAGLACWNLGNKRFWMSLSQMLHCVVILILSGRYLFGHDFWRGVSDDHVPQSLHRILESAG